MKKQRIAIVGAGICGLYLARELSKKYEVTIFEQKKEIGKEACSGLFSEKILDFIPDSKKLIKNRIKSTLIHFPKRDIELFFSQDFLVINHSKLDQLVAKTINQNKVNIVLERKIKALPEGFDRIIGCDGASSITREKIGLPNTRNRIGILGFSEKENYSSMVEVWPTLNGFIWKIPRGNNVEYGIIEDIKKGKEKLNSFLDKRKIKIKNLKSALIPQGFEIPKNKKITLCGDAAGLTKPWSGGGVIWGLIAADILLKNFPDFLEYKKEVEKFFKLKLFFSKILTKLVYFFGFNFPYLIPQKVNLGNDFLIFNKNE
jgi:flavin-dependent dehydrogenase